MSFKHSAAQSNKAFVCCYFESNQLPNLQLNVGWVPVLCVVENTREGLNFGVNFICKWVKHIH